MDENWDDLRYFLALARAGTLVDAGVSLKVSHTTVQRRVRQLEDSVRVRLFDRSPDGFVLTSHGERLLAEVERMEGSLRAVARDIVGADARVEGSVAVTAAPLVAHRLLPPLIAGLKRCYPALAVELRSSVAVADLARREADVAVRITASPSQALVGRRVGEIPFAICASEAYLRDHPTDRYPVAVDGHHFVVDEVHLGTEPMRWLAEHVGSGAVTVTDCVSTVSALCQAGVGIALLPAHVAALDDLVVLDTAPMPPMPVWVLTHADLRSAARIRAVVAYLGDHLRALLETPLALRRPEAIRAAG